jgi:hypothetical protein
VFTARYALSPYIKQIRVVFKGLNMALSYSSYLFLPRDYCLLGCDAVQVDRYKRFVTRCCLPVPFTVKLEAERVSEIWNSPSGMHYVVSYLFTIMSLSRHQKHKNFKRRSLNIFSVFKEMEASHMRFVHVTLWLCLHIFTVFRRVRKTSESDC